MAVISKITISLGDKEIELTLEEATQLKSALENLFPGPKPVSFMEHVATLQHITDPWRPEPRKVWLNSPTAIA